MVTPVLKSVVEKAYQIFSRHAGISPLAVSTERSMIEVTAELKPLSDQMHAADGENVNLHEILSRCDLKKIEEHKTVIFIDVESAPSFTAMMIVIPPGLRLPLHDHPNMVGLIKVLHGQIRIRSFSKAGPPEEERQAAVMVPTTVFSKSSYPHILTPLTNNIHEIEYVSGESGKDYAAFLDVLSPPYDDSVGCSYYKYKDISNSLRCTLKVIGCPSEYRTVSIRL